VKIVQELQKRPGSHLLIGNGAAFQTHIDNAALHEDLHGVRVRLEYRTYWTCLTQPAKDPCHSFFCIQAGSFIRGELLRDDLYAVVGVEVVDVV
jgi:hypothetical protein